MLSPSRSTFSVCSLILVRPPSVSRRLSTPADPLAGARQSERLDLPRLQHGHHDVYVLLASMHARSELTLRLVYSNSMLAV